MTIVRTAIISFIVGFTVAAILNPPYDFGDAGAVIFGISLLAVLEAAKAAVDSIDMDLDRHKQE